MHCTTLLNKERHLIEINVQFLAHSCLPTVCERPVLQMLNAGVDLVCLLYFHEQTAPIEIQFIANYIK